MDYSAFSNWITTCDQSNLPQTAHVIFHVWIEDCFCGFPEIKISADVCIGSVDAVALIRKDIDSRTKDLRDMRQTCWLDTVPLKAVLESEGMWHAVMEDDGVPHVISRHCVAINDERYMVTQERVTEYPGNDLYEHYDCPINYCVGALVPSTPIIPSFEEQMMYLAGCATRVYIDPFDVMTFPRITAIYQNKEYVCLIQDAVYPEPNDNGKTKERLVYPANTDLSALGDVTCVEVSTDSYLDTNREVENMVRRITDLMVLKGVS